MINLKKQNVLFEKKQVFFVRKDASLSFKIPLDTKLPFNIK